MKNISIRLLLSFILLTVFYFTAAAQNADSIYKNKRLMDSLYKKMLKDHYVPDTGVYSANRPIKRKIQRDSLGHRKDTLFLAQRKLADSNYKKILFSRKTANLFRDSSLKKVIVLNRSYDSAKRKIAIQRIKTDSLYRKKMLFSRMPDSLKRMNTLLRFKSDSLRRLYVMSSRLDSFHRFKKFQSLRLDSMKRILLFQNIK